MHEKYSDELNIIKINSFDVNRSFKFNLGNRNKLDVNKQQILMEFRRIN